VCAHCIVELLVQPSGCPANAVSTHSPEGFPFANTGECGQESKPAQLTPIPYQAGMAGLEAAQSLQQTGGICLSPQTWSKV
jgi:hypothetical protein